MPRECAEGSPRLGEQALNLEVRGQIFHLQRNGYFFAAVQKRKSSAAFLARGIFRHLEPGQVGPEFYHSRRINCGETNLLRRFQLPIWNVCWVILGCVISACLEKNALDFASDLGLADCGVE